MAGYAGHRNWTHWNVSLWLSNDEGLYRTAKTALKRNRTKDAAARELMALLPQETPDGARYSFTNIRAALTDFE